MILQKDGGQVGKTISHYHILEKLPLMAGQVGEVRLLDLCWSTNE